MGEKEIRQTPPGPAKVVTPPPPPPMTTEKQGTGGPTTGDPNIPNLPAVEAAAKAGVAAKATGPYETLFKDGWREGRDTAGYRYAIDPNGIQGVWNPNTNQYLDPDSGKPYPAGWGSGHTP